MDTHEMVKEAFRKVTLWQRAKKAIFGTPLTKPISRIGTVTPHGRMAERILSEFTYRHPRALAAAQKGNLKALSRDFESFKKTFFKEMGMTPQAQKLVEGKLRSFAGSPRVLGAQVIRRTRRMQRGLEKIPAGEKLPDIRGAITRVGLPAAALGTTVAAVRGNGQVTPQRTAPAVYRSPQVHWTGY